MTLDDLLRSQVTGAILLPENHFWRSALHNHSVLYLNPGKGHAGELPLPHIARDLDLALNFEGKSK
jgi:hypothetical protein